MNKLGFYCVQSRNFEEVTSLLLLGGATDRRCIVGPTLKMFLDYLESSIKLPRSLLICLSGTKNIVCENFGDLNEFWWLKCSLNRLRWESLSNMRECKQSYSPFVVVLLSINMMSRSKHLVGLKSDAFWKVPTIWKVVGMICT